ncbi:MAG: hypothetical protein AMXMBFR7_51900 [Planctomycetota bacterium]
MGRTYASVDKKDLAKAVSDSKPRSETEKSKRTSDLKRYVAFLCQTVAEHAPGFV